MNRTPFQTAPSSLSSPASALSPLHITFESMNTLEESLDFYEVVSLVFLLYDNAHTAFQNLAVAEVTANVTGKQSNGLICEWVRDVQDKQPRWQETLLEALAIVQCYAALKKLGFRKDDMNARFLPLNFECSINVHPVKKTLYRMCEDLSKDLIDILLENVKYDLTKQKFEANSIFATDNRYLEMHLLYWVTIRYITISNDHKNDLEHLMSVLGQMNMRRWCARLELSVKRANAVYEDLLAVRFQKKLVFDRNKELSSNDESMSSSTATSMCSYYEEPASRRYEMNARHAGVVIIINQKHFVGKEVRHGTDFDRDRLREAWRTFGFDVVIHEDLTFVQIQRKIKDSIKEAFRPEHCCLVVVVLSHGGDGTVFGTDMEPEFIINIANAIMSTDKLLGKPKILMIQACQGDRKEKAIVLRNEISGQNEELPDEEMHLVGDGVPAEKPKVSFKHGDFYQIVACTPGHQSVRDKRKGTWLIQTFCDVLQENGAREHFDDMITTTKDKISNKTWGGTGMVPVVGPNTFNKRLYFIPADPNL